MTRFVAVFVSDDGRRVLVHFRSYNWAGVEDAARDAFNSQSHSGSWSLHSVDVC